MAEKERTAVDAEREGGSAEADVSAGGEPAAQEGGETTSGEAPSVEAENAGEPAAQEAEDVPDADREPAAEEKDADGDAADEPADVDPAALQEEVARWKAEAEQWQARYVRVLADLENVRRRKNEEIAALKEYAAEDVLKRLLPVLDNLERAEAAAENAVSAEVVALREGLSLVLRQFRQVLQQEGVEPIESVGKPFDPHLHEAVLEVEASEEHPAGTVVEELQKGYRMRDRILRYSMVKVAVE